MKLNRFEVVTGRYIEEILGQSRIGYAMSDTTDFYDMNWIGQKKVGYQGSTISFMITIMVKFMNHFKNREMCYMELLFNLKKSFWFLQGDYNSGKITLFKYYPDQIPEMITQLNIEDVNLYNLRIIGEDVYIVSEDDEFVSYYPEVLDFPRVLMKV